WLTLARSGKTDGPNPLTRMAAEERLALWATAIGKAKELWGDSWGIAMNSDARRTQCHLHVHIGKLLQDQETDGGVWADGPAQLPVIADGAGFWFHPVGGRLHVHIGV